MKRVQEVHSFCQTAMKNNQLLIKYIRQLRMSGNNFGHIQIRISDIMYGTESENLIFEDTCTNKDIDTGKVFI